MPSDQLYETAKLYGAARLNFFSQLFVEAQEQLKMQELVFISMKQGYLNARGNLTRAHDCYQRLTSLVRIQIYSSRQ